MLGSITSRVIQKAADRGMIKDSDIEDYSYGLDLILTIAVTDLSALLIGLIMKSFVSVLIFWIVYKALRKYVGGFHFDNSVICYLSSCVLCISNALFVKYAVFNSSVYLTVMLVSSAAMFILAPVEAKQKPLDEREYEVFKVIARILVGIAVLIYFVAFSYDNIFLQKVMMFSCLCVTGFSIIGKILINSRKNKYKRSHTD